MNTLWIGLKENQYIFSKFFISSVLANAAWRVSFSMRKKPYESPSRFLQRICMLLRDWGFRHGLQPLCWAKGSAHAAVPAS